MSWNGSGQRNEQSGKPQVRSGLRLGRGVLAGGLVVALALAVWCLLSKSEKPASPESDQARDKTIAEVTPAAPPKVEEPKVEPPKPIDPNARPTKVGEVVNGYVKLPSGRIHKRVGVITNSVASRPKGWYEIFDRNCDNEIACYLTLKPGDTLIGTPRYNGRFVKDFLESIKEPIVISPDDTPEQAQLKKEVIATRLELKDAYDRGEDIEQIMLDTRQQFQDLMHYKMEIRQLFNEERKQCMTEQEVEDTFDACNKLLESKGIAPIKFGPIIRRRLMSQQLGE